MADYVILNLAEETGAGTGVTKKVEDAILAHGKKQVTTKILLWKSTKIVQNNTVHKYDLVEKFNHLKNGENFGIGKEQINEMNQACSTADAVFLCAHGSATDRNQVFTQRGEVGNSKVEMLATVVEFASFADMVLDTVKTHDLRLIVCFAARSVNPDKKHTKDYLENSENHTALKSSLAYQLFKYLDQKGKKTKMTARLGEVRVSPSKEFEMEILTQTEEGVIAGLGLKAASAEEQNLGKNLSDIRKAELRTFITMGVKELEPKKEKPEEGKWVAAYKKFVKLNNEKQAQAMQTEKGRLKYEKEGAILVISFEGDELYRGQML